MKRFRCFRCKRLFELKDISFWKTKHTCQNCYRQLKFEQKSEEFQFKKNEQERERI